jgi:hypothetical protein
MDPQWKKELDAFRVAIVQIFLQFPMNDYLCPDEIRTIFVIQLSVSPQLTSKHIKEAFQYKSSLLLKSQPYGKEKYRYYIRSDIDRALFVTDRSADWSLPTIDLPVESIIDHVQTINAYLYRETVSPKPKAPTFITCKGFRGDKFDNLFKQSFLAGPLQTMKLGETLPTSFDLPDCIKSVGANELHFVLEKKTGWKLASKECRGSFLASSNLQQIYCGPCASLKGCAFNICQRDGSDVSQLKRVSKKRYLELCQNPDSVRTLFENQQRKWSRQLEAVQSEKADLAQQIVDYRRAIVNQAPPEE